MATEPTLGRRILTSAMCLHITAGSDDLHEEWATLRALCAHADAAERLAAAADVFSAADAGDDGPTDAEIMDYDNALAAWRAITEEAQP